MKYVYLISCSYSGSTLLAMLMNSHPEIASIGELTNIIGYYFKDKKDRVYYCSCGARIEECSFWEEVQRICEKEELKLDLYDFKTNLDIGLGRNFNRYFFGLPYKLSCLETLRNRSIRLVPRIRREIDRIIRNNMKIAEAVLKVTNKKIFFDASKDPVKAFHLLRMNGHNIKIIHLVRNPFGFLNSSMKRHNAGNYDIYIRSWVAVNQSALKLRTTSQGVPYRLMRYEELCRDPQGTIKDICEFIGVEAVNLVTRVNENQQHIIGNRMRRREFNCLKYDEEWRRTLTNDQINKCKEIAGSTADVLGY